MSPHLFVMVIDVLTENVRDGSLVELLCADDLVLCSESLDEVMNQYRRWKNAVKRKSLRMNIDKIKGMQVDPCDACGKLVDCNSIQCTKCQRWVHRCCSDVPRQVSLLACSDVFVCRTCLGHNRSGEEKLEFKRGENVLVEKFCYLGDLISSYDAASEAVSARIGNAQKKFRKLIGVLVGKRGLSLKQLGKIYQHCATPVLWYCCERLEPSVAN